MKRLNSFFLSNVLYKKVYDEDDECIGKLWDIYVTTENGYPKAIGYKIKKGGEFLNCEFKNIWFCEENGKYLINVTGARDIILRKYSYLLSKNLLDKQIVDINGKKLVRVNDLRIVEIVGEYKVIAADTGVMALGRRMGVEGLVKQFYSIMKRQPVDSIIMWDNVESLEIVNDNLKLSIPYQKLSKLHPADIADILEDMDANYRRRVFESLDEDLAADTLEEIEPEIQASLLENLSFSKRAEVLDNMPNDEIADMLDEVDEDTVERILLNMAHDDAEEVRALMEYEEETAGSIMNKDFISFNVNITAQETIELLRELKPENEVAYYIYIIDEQGKLLGVVSLRDLVVSNPNTKLRDIMDDGVMHIKDNENINKAIEIAGKYDLLSLPVIDKDDLLCGVIIMSDIVEDVLLPTWRKSRKRAV